jgi:hypothetical protein
MITRAYAPLDAYLQPGKVLVIYGPRRVGKTTLLREFLAHTSRALWDFAGKGHI